MYVPLQTSFFEAHGFCPQASLNVFAVFVTAGHSDAC